MLEAPGYHWQNIARRRNCFTLIFSELYRNAPLWHKLRSSINLQRFLNLFYHYLDKNPCSPTPCRHLGQCVALQDADYRCVCHSSKYSGKDCEKSKCTPARNSN